MFAADGLQMVNNGLGVGREPAATIPSEDLQEDGSSHLC